MPVSRYSRWVHGRESHCSMQELQIYVGDIKRGFSTVQYQRVTVHWYLICLDL
jgi:hypothetical protein